LKNPRITVITVCYNSAATIADTLESIATQSYRNFEHIVVDGGSTDETLAIVSGWAKHPIRLVSEPDDGVYDAMNKGFALATGDVIGFLNADDFYADPSVLGQIAIAFRDDAVDACHADLVYVSKDGKKAVRFWESSPFRKGAFALAWCPPHPTFYVRKHVIERLGYFDLSYRLAADTEFMVRYLESGGVRSRYIPRVWVRMRVGGQTNQSVGNVIQQNKEILTVLRKYGMRVSVFMFVLRKVINRIGQYGSGLLKNIK